MKIVNFYQETHPNHNGDWLPEILLWSDDKLEQDHNYIQYIFGSNERSSMNSDAPVLTKEESIIFQNSEELKEKVKESFIRILKFLEFEIKDEEIKPINEKPKWLEYFNHNFFRVTRILKSLRLKGLGKYALMFFNALKEFKNEVSLNTWNHWEKAINDRLWN